MPVMIFTMLIVLVLAAAVIAVVVMGMEGTGRKQHPEIAEAMARTARHLNGEGEPPKALVQLFDEMDEVPDLNVRELPGKLRSLRSAASARSAWSARSATSANPPEAEDEDDRVWAPEESAPEASEVDESAAREMSAALDAPVVTDPEAADPYGVWGAADADQEPPVEVEGADGDTIVRVRLPEGDPRG